MIPLPVRPETQPLVSDERLVRRVLDGEREAYAELVRRYERQVHAAAWAILRDHHAAQDVTQEAFVKAYRQLGELRDARTFGVWLLTIARRTAIDASRRSEQVRYVAKVPDTTASTPTAEEDATIVLAAAAKLSDHEQQVVLLRYVDGLAVAEIAERLSCPVGTVTKKLSRALSRLRGFLKETP
jgi:RNA polymerase sigma-70 factor (ECF subfamily)